MKSVQRLIVLATLFWFILFSPWTKNLFNFWWGMTFASGTLAISAIILERKYLKSSFTFKPQYLIIGIASAFLLYIIFFLGNRVADSLFRFSNSQVAAIYSTRSQASPLLIGSLLFFWIGPAEEIFWRGFVQRHLSEKHGIQRGWLITSLIYAFVHIWAFNNMLLLAALLCGLFWGLMYAKFKSVIPGLISHAIWDVFIFVIAPIN